MAYPDRMEDVQRLIEQHRQLEHQTLLLALYYGFADDRDDVHLMEVISPFGYNEVNEDRDLFEMQYGSTPGFPLSPGKCLSILLTNSVEARTAIRQEWSAIVPVLKAVHRGDYRVLHVEGEGSTVLEELQKHWVAA